MQTQLMSRTSSQNHRSRSATSKIRDFEKQRLLDRNELYEEEEGILYGAGIAD